MNFLVIDYQHNTNIYIDNVRLQKTEGRGQRASIDKESVMGNLQYELEKLPITDLPQLK